MSGNNNSGPSNNKMSDMMTAFTNAFMTSLRLTVKDWPAWIGFAASEYVGGMIEQQFVGQNMPLRYLALGIADTQKQSYYYALKHPEKAAKDAAM